jgi:hypothetical protein
MPSFTNGAILLYSSRRSNSIATRYEFDYGYMDSLWSSLQAGRPYGGMEETRIVLLPF